MIKLFSIGSAGKSAERFFHLLQAAGVEKLLDTRLNHSSQLAGFAKSRDLKFFSHEIAGISYEHRPEFAPTAELLRNFRNKVITWNEYEKEYVYLLQCRKIASIEIATLDNCCLLCAEHSPERCHRRLLAEYICTLRDNVKVTHLM